MSLAGLAEKEAGNQAFREGDLERALEFYSQAVDANPHEPTYYSNRSAAYYKLGKFQRAIDDAMKCVELRPEWPKGFFRLGEAYHARGLFAKASDAFSTALDLDPTDVGVREALARSQKALYEKTVEEGRTTKVPASNLARYESDDEDRPAVPPPATASYASLRSTEERHREIMNRRLQQSTGISSLEEYMKYRNQGGAPRPSADPLAGGPSAPAPAKTADPRVDFMRSMGLDDKLSTSMSSSGAPNGFSSTAGCSSTTSSSKSDLAKQRAEFLASLNRSGAIPAEGGSGNAWAKISASDRLAASTASQAGADPPRGPAGPSSESSPSSTASGTPMFGRRSNTPPQGLPQMETYAMPPPPRPPDAAAAAGTRHAAAKGRGPTAAPDQAEGEEVDTMSLATVAVLGASVSANHPLFAGLRTKARPDAIKADESTVPLKKKYD
eukprot:EG_transcript_12406